MSDLRTKLKDEKRKRIDAETKVSILEEALQQSPETGQVDAIVMRSGYLGVIGNQKVFVVAEDEDKAVNELYKASGDEEFDLLDLGRISIIVSA